MLHEELLDGLVLETSLAALQSDDLLKQMTEAINELINHDFGKLVQVLYRVDVSENLVKKMLQDHPAEDAASLIAVLLIERQVQKIQSKQKWKSGETDVSDEEKW